MKFGDNTFKTSYKKAVDVFSCLFVVYTYALANCSSDEVKDEFYIKLSNLQNVQCSVVVIVVGDFNAQVGRLNQYAMYLDWSYDFAAQRTDNDDRLLQLRLDKHMKKHSLIWLSPQSTHWWTQINHFAISHSWRGSTEDCCSFWSTCLDSNHALVRACVLLDVEKPQEVNHLKFDFIMKKLGIYFRNNLEWAS